MLVSMSGRLELALYTAKYSRLKVSGEVRGFKGGGRTKKVWAASESLRSLAAKSRRFQVPRRFKITAGDLRPVPIESRMEPVQLNHPELM